MNELGLSGSSGAAAGPSGVPHSAYPVAPSRSNGSKTALPEPASQFAAAAAAREAAREASREAAREAARGAAREAASAREAAVAAAAAAAAAQNSDSDNEEEPAVRGTRNDGTLLASDPPKPLSVSVIYFLIRKCIFYLFNSL